MSTDAEVNEVCQQAIDSQNARDTAKEQLEEDLAELRRMMVDHDAWYTNGGQQFIAAPVV